MPVVIVKDLKKIYGSGATETIALSNAHVTVEKGQLVALLGPSGSGKTTLLTGIGLVNEPTGGYIEIAGTTVYDNGWAAIDLAAFRRKNIGFIFQHHNLLPFLSAYDNVNLMLHINGIKGKGASDKINETLDYLELGHRMHHFPYMLSGGENQRVAIARAVISDPEIILADEPTAALDTERGLKVMSMLKKIAREKNTGVIVVTHDKRMIDGFDFIYSLKDGAIV